MYDVAALGELLIDFTCLSTDADGYPTMAAHPGGAPANYLAALTKFGAKTAMIGKVGNDAFGRLLIKTLKGAGIDTRGMLVSDDVFTTLAFVTLDDSGNREFSFARKPGADTQLRFDEIDLGVIDASKVLHFGTLSMTNEPARDATYKAVEYAAERIYLVALARKFQIVEKRHSAAAGRAEKETGAVLSRKRRKLDAARCDERLVRCDEMFAGLQRHRRI